MRKIRQLLIVCILIFLSQESEAKILVLDPGLLQSGISLGSHLEFKKSNAKTPSEIPADDAWISVTSENPNFGYTRDSYWARLRIHNPGPAIRLVFEFRGLITQVAMVDSNGNSSVSGIAIGLEKNMPLARFPIFVTEVPSGDSVYYFFNHTASKQFPLRAFPLEGFAERNYLDVFLLTLCCGIILGLALYYLLTCFVIRRLDVILYTAYAFFALLFTLFLSGIARIFLPELGNVLTGYYLAFASTSSLCSLAFAAVYLNLQKYHPRIMKVYQLGMFVAFVTLLLSLHPTSYFWGMRLQQSVVFFWGMSIYLGLKARSRGYKPALWFALAWIAMVAGTALAMASGAGLLQSTAAQNGIFIGTTLELILMSLSMSEKIKDKERNLAMKLRDLNRSLEQTIQERTKDITSYLSNIQQGILQIQRNKAGTLEIKEHHSRHLLEMLDTQHDKVAFAHPLPAILEKLSLSDDEKSKCLDILDTALGESLLQWDINQDNLAREARIVQTQKLIEIEWSPVLNENDLVDSVLVSFKDVTEIRGLKEQALRESRKGMLIAIVANMKTDMARNFFRMIDGLMGENIALIAAHAKQEPWTEQDRQVLYRNVHTIKGSARGLGLNELVTALHSMESLISEQRLTELRPLHDEVARTILDLRLINDDILGRRSQQLNAIELSWDDLEKAVQAFPGHEPLQRSVRKHIRLLGSSNLEKALQNELAMLPDLAARLDKEAPRVSFEHDDYALSEPLMDGLRRIFIHLFRNSLDHGLESTDVRLAEGKNRQGLITIRVQDTGSDRMTILYRDDGKGLDLERIRGKGLSLGLDRTQDLSSAETVANLIFLPSFTTKVEADEISGRGVGMDAIRAYVEELGGRVVLKLEAEKERAGYFDFAIVMDVPRTHFIPLASETFETSFSPMPIAG